MQTTTDQTSREQIALWNGAAGHAWVETQASLDRLFEPFEKLLGDAVAARGAQRVLDVGSGTGSTTLAVARRLGARGACVGVDLSQPMIDLADARAALEQAPPRFICADAQRYEFEPATFDMIISRFGVMFFDDPVRAFANLRRAAAPGAELTLIAWRSPAENPFMTAAERAAAAFLPAIPPRGPEEPGQFAFANRDRVYSILEQSGWAAIDIQPLDVACALPEPELVPYFTRLGPIGRALQGADERTRSLVIQTARAAFDSYVHGTEVRFTAACWAVGARAAG